MANQLNSNENNIQEISVQTGTSVYDIKIQNNSRIKFTLQDFLNLDPFDEDEAEQQFLDTKPICFLIIGKPGSGKTTIAKKLASEWKAELVNPTELIIQNIKDGTELGKKSQDILLKGEALPESIVAKMIDEKINSPEVAHHGYVLDGFPSHSENNFDIGKQMEMMKNWKLQPDFIINLRIPDKDLLRRRIYQKVDPISGNLYIKEMYAPNKSKQQKKAENENTEGDEEEEVEGEENEEEKSEEVQDEFFAVIANDVVERLVIRPEDTLPFVESAIKTFKEALLHVLEDQMANMDQSFLLELDSNLSPTILMKQLLLRLESYPIRKAAKALRMSEPVEVSEEESGNSDHFIDSSEIEESISLLQTKKRLASKFKWRRSKCSFYCPVSLKDGKIVSGKPDYAAAFLDKIYLMADENRLREFLKNPRSYLKLPQPRAPCKISILGTDYTGKTSLAAIMAKKYNASVIDMKSLMMPKIKKANEESIQRIKIEATESAIELIKQKFKEKIEQEKTRREQEQVERAAALIEAHEDQETEDNQEKETQDNQEENTENKLGEETVDQNSLLEIQKEESITNEPIDYAKIDPNVIYNDEGDIIVDLNHPEIHLGVEKALEENSKHSFNLPASEYVKVLKEEIEKLRKQRAKIDPTAPNDGGWILDNFPNDSEQLNAMGEHGIIPDTFIVLQDSTDDSNIILKRWYRLNKKEIDEKISKRLAAEELLKIQQQKKEAELKKAQQIDLDLKDESDLDSEMNIDKTLTVDIIPTQDEEMKTLEKIIEEEEPRDLNSVKSDLSVEKISTENRSQSEKKSKKKSDINSEYPSKGAETQEFLNQLKPSLDNLKNLQNTISTITGSDPAFIQINKSTKESEKSLEELTFESANIIEKMFKFSAVDFDGIEEEEPEENDEDDDKDDEEEEDFEEGEDEADENIFDPTLKEKKISFGESGHYCPVTLYSKNILVPGNPEYQCKYRERFYRFSSEENKKAFFENPLKYLPNSRKKLKIPPPRFLVLGPRGSGKSTQARYLAEKLNIFHVKFRDYLQELIIGKTKKRIDTERDEDREEEEIAEDDDEDNEEKRLKQQKKAEPLPELSEREEVIKAYLEKDEVLPPEIMDEVIPQLWNVEPFKSRGFVLEGFPNNESQAHYLIDKGFFPDGIIILRVEDEVVVKRLLPERLEAWRTKMKAKKEKKMLKAKRKKEKLMKQMKARRDEEIAKFEEKRRKKEEEAAENGEEYEDEEFDVDALIQEEFSEQLQEEEEVEEVQEDEIKENMINDIKTRFENELSYLDVTKDALQEVLIPRFTVDSNRKPNIVSFLIKKRLKRFIDNRQSLFERVYPIKLRIANKLIDFGYKRLSRFGRWCPIKLFENEPVQTLYDENRKPYLAIHRSFIYFFSSKEARESFSEDPLKYLKQPSPLSVVPFKLSIIGPPKSGKTTLAKRFAKEFGCVRLSAGEAIRSVLDNQPYTELAENIRSYLTKGKTVPDELTIQCIELALLDVKCQLRGFVFDNFPVKKEQIKIMTDRSLIPVKVIELKCDVKEIMHRCIKDRTSAERMTSGLILNDSPEIIGYKLKEWKDEIVFLRDWYMNEHKNLIQLDGTQSKWNLWDQAKKIGFESVRTIQVYLNRISQHKAACIANLCVTYDEMLNRLGDFGQYCPVSLALYDELIDCSENRSMNFVAEYQGFYYKMKSKKELELFLDDPEKFIPPKAPRKLPPPSLLPKRRSAIEVKELFPKPVELNGYCPVTYYVGKLRYEALEQGSSEFAAEYKNKLYFMANLEMLEEFLKKPEIYSALKLPHKLPPVKNALNVLELPMTGYLEQTVAELLKKALSQVGDFKPKFPFLSPTKSALLYVAYFLKAYNPKSSEYRKKKYRQKLLYFQQKCELIDYLYKQTTLKYKEPSKRSNEYNVKLDSFFALQDNMPTMNWLS
ncbi:unnamed protein product [Brachionus calyciflorus]|uniref:AAA+ ATPase domain-containing protein n=1 Tax=Brachionus calyciflorus TaxID=104777 RepID=A0A813R2L1_9BILA|nr:unnamed protein product [Brachionus calyciflorus]